MRRCAALLQEEDPWNGSSVWNGLQSEEPFPRNLIMAPSPPVIPPDAPLESPLTDWLASSTFNQNINKYTD